MSGCTISKISTDFYENPNNWATYTYPRVGCQLKHPSLYVKQYLGYWSMPLNEYMPGVLQTVRLQRLDDKLEVMLHHLQSEDFSSLPARIRNDPESFDNIGYQDETLLVRETVRTESGLEGLKAIYQIYPTDDLLTPDNHTADRVWLSPEEEITKIFVYFVFKNEMFELIFTGESYFVAELETEIDAIIKSFTVIPLFSEEEMDGKRNMN